MPEAPAFILIPGAGGVGWYWHRVVEGLQHRGYEAIAVDLPGDDESADLPDYVDVVVSAAGDRSDVVIVGQSLGGFTAVLACDRLSVSRLVLVNAMIPAPGETAGEWWDNVGQAAARAEMDAREGRDPDGDFDEATYFLHDLPPELLPAAAATARNQANRPFGAAASFERWPSVTTHVIVGRDDRFFPAEFQCRVARERLGIDPDLLPGGHLMALSRPAELIDQLMTYVGQ